MEEIFAFYTNVSVNRQLFRQIAVSGTVAAIDVVVSATHNTASFSPSAAHIEAVCQQEQDSQRDRMRERMLHGENKGCF